MRCNSKLLPVLAILAVLCVTASRALAQDFVVVPNTLASAEGNEASEFLTGDPRASSIRYQQVFAASQFTRLGTITQIAFRPDTARGTAFSTTLSNVRIALSTTSRTPDGLSAIFADNIGINEVAVFNGDLTLTSAYLPGPGGTRSFDIVINLSTPFTYDPGLGNLLFDFQRDTSPLNPVGVSFDAHDLTGDSISRVFGSRTSPTGQFGVDTVGVVARFTVTPVPASAVIPEPSSVAFLGSGFLILLGYGWNRRKQTAV